MKKERYFNPSFEKNRFHCPHSNCGVYSLQRWSTLYATGGYSINKKDYKRFVGVLEGDWVVSKCDSCEQYTIWNDEEIIYPKSIRVVSPNDDLNNEIKFDYMEAAKIFNDSPRASGALIRLALQKLMIQLGEKGKNINDDIAKLVKKGLNPNIQQSLDILRITGNNAVHPGEINLEDKPEKVLKLFDLVNIIAEKMITEPNEIKSLYEDLPEKAKEAVKKRDK